MTSLAVTPLPPPPAPTWGGPTTPGIDDAVPFEHAVATLIKDFDRNRDGHIVDVRVWGFRLLRESSYTTSSRKVDFGFNHGRPEMLVGVRTYRAWAINELMAAADLDRDDVATRTELLAAVRVYDVDRDGRLSAAEFARVRQDLGGRHVSTRREITPIIEPSERDRRRR
ncbi:MAG: hypothetical protein JWO69_1213 [Thermoleophilia bacterium]|nr:hypothetical protein [Thermoleophilia bacterium]